MAIVLKLRRKVREISRVVHPFERRIYTSCLRGDNNVVLGISITAQGTLAIR